MLEVRALKEKAVNAKEVKEEGDFHEENAPRENSTRFSGAFGSRRGVILALILCTTSCVVEDRVNWTDLLTTGREGFENASLYVRTKQPSPAARSESSKHHENRGDLRVKLTTSTQLSDTNIRPPLHGITQTRRLRGSTKSFWSTHGPGGARHSTPGSVVSSANPLVPQPQRRPRRRQQRHHRW